MPGKLVSLAKGREKQTYPVVSLHVFIGSDSYCDIRIEHKNVSPQHCLITAQKDKPTLIRNLSRTSPTLVNGSEIGSKDVELKDQDIITICNKQFKWKYDGLSMPSNVSSMSPVKGRKSWPLFKNKLVAVVTPHRRDEDLPLKKRRGTYGPEKLNSSSKKGKVLGIKSGVKGRKSNAKKQSVIISPTAVQLNVTQALGSKRKSVKFAETPHDRRLGKRSKISHGPPTPYRSSATPGKKASLYFTPSSVLGSSKTPTKGILKTPGTQPRNESQSTSRLTFSNQLPNLESTPPALPESLLISTEPLGEESGLRTPPMEESDQPEIVMRSSKRSSLRRVLGPSPESTPKSASKTRIGRTVSDDEVLEASERAANKLKLFPSAIDKKKMAALIQCHRKSLTPHPKVNRKGRLQLLIPSPKAQPHPLPKDTPKSAKKVDRPRKSEPTPYSTFVPRALRFGNTEPKPSLIRKKKKTFKPIKLERKYPMGRSTVAKMLSSPSPPGRKMTRATRAARASREQVQRREATDVLSALDLSRKWPAESKSESSNTSQNPTSPIADITNASGIKQLFSTDKTLDVRELFLENGTEKSPIRSSLGSTPESTGRKSRRSSGLKSSETFNSFQSFNIEGVQELLATPPSVLSVSQQSPSTSRRSLTLKGIKSPPLPSSPTNSESVKTPSPVKKKLSNSKQSISASRFNVRSGDEKSSLDFSLGSFNASKYKSIDSNFSSPTSVKNSQSPLEKSTSKKMSSSFKPSIFSSSKKSRTSLRRVALNTSTTKALSMSLQEFQTIGQITTIDLTKDDEQSLPSLPLKKRSIKTVLDSSLTSRLSRRFLKGETNVNSLVSDISPSKKSKGRTSITSPLSLSMGQLENVSTNVVDSLLSNASLKVHVGSIQNSVNVSNYRLSRSSGISKLSESANLENRGSPKLSLTKTSSSTGKIKKVGKSRLQVTSPLKNTSTRSRSSVNIDLFSLDKLPLDIPSSTPLRTKPVRTMFKKVTSTEKFPNNKIAKSKSSSDVNLNKREPSGNKATRKSETFSSVILHNSTILSKSERTRTPDETSWNKSTRSKSTEVLKTKSGLFLSSLPNKTQKLTSPLENSWNKSTRKSKIFSPLVMHNSTLLNKSERTRTPDETSWNKSTRSKSSVNIDLFKLDDKPSGVSKELKISKSPSEILFKSNIAHTLLGTSRKSSSFNTSSVDKNLSKLDDKASPQKTESGRKPRSRLSKIIRKSEADGNVSKLLSNVTLKETSKTKSTRSKSLINLDLFKLDDINSESSSRTPLKRKPSRSKSAEASSKKSEIFSLNESRSLLDSSNVSVLSKNKSRVSQAVTPALKLSGNKSSRSRSSVVIDTIVSEHVSDEPPDNVENSFSASIRSPKYEKLLNASSSLSSPLNRLNKSIKISSPEVISKNATRSRSTVNIDLFKLDDKDSESSLRTSLKRKLSRSKSAEVSSRKSEILSQRKNESGNLFEASNFSVFSKGKSPRVSQAVTPALEISGNKSTRIISPIANDKSVGERSRGSVTKSLFKSFEEKPDDDVENIFSASLRSPKYEKLKNASSSLGSPLNRLNKSIKISSPDVNNKNATRSRSTVNIDLFKLEDKDSESSLRTSLKRKLPRSKSAEVSSRKSEILSQSKNESGNLIEASNLSVLSKGKSPRVSQTVTPALEISGNKSTRTRSHIVNDNSVSERSRGSVTKSPRKSFVKKPDDDVENTFSTSLRSPKFEKQLNTSSSCGSPLNRFSKSSKTPLKISSPAVNSIKATRSKSSVNIDLFKLDEKPSGSMYLNKLNVQSFLETSSEDVTEKSFVSLRSPKSRKLGEQNDSIELRNSLQSPGLAHSTPAPSRKSLKSRFEASLLKSSTQKPTRSKSSVNIDLFKLDQTSSSKKSLKREIFRSKSSDTSLQMNNGLEKSSKNLSKSSIDPLHLINSPLKSNSSFASKETSRASKSWEIINSPSENKSTRSRSSVNIDLFKLDEAKSPNLGSTSSSHLSFSNVTGNRTSLSSDNGTLSSIKPKKQGSSRLPSSSTVSPSSLKSCLTSELDKPRSIKEDDSISADNSFRNKSTRSTSTIDLFNKNESSKRDMSPKQAKKSSLTPSLKQLTLSSAKKDSTLSSPRKARMSPRVYLTPLKIGFHKSSKKVTPKTFISSSTQTSTTIKKIKKTPYAKKNQFGRLSKYQIVNFANNTTPVCDYKQQTKALLSPRAKRSLRQKELDESQRTPESNTNDRTPLSAISPKGRLSLSEKRTPYDKRHSSKKISLPEKDAKNDSQSSSPAISENILRKSVKVTNRSPRPNKVELSPSKSPNVSKKGLREPSKGSTDEISEPLNKKLKMDKPIKSVDTLKSSSSKGQNIEKPLPLQVSCIESSVKVTPQQKSRTNILKSPKVSSSTDLLKQSKKMHDSSFPEDSPKPQIRRGRSHKAKISSPPKNKLLTSPVIKNSHLKVVNELNSPIHPQKRRGRPKVVALKISTTPKNKVLSSSIIVNSAVQNKRKARSAAVNSKKELNSSGSSPVVPIVRRGRRGKPPSPPSVVKKEKIGKSSKEIILKIETHGQQYEVPVPRRGRAAVQEQTVKSVHFQAVPEPPKEISVPKSSKRGRQAAAVEPPIKVLAPEPLKRGTRAAHVEPPKEVLAPEPLKRGTRAAHVEPPKEVSSPKRLRKVSPDDPLKEVLASEPLKRGRKPALVEPPKEVSALEPLKRGRKAAPVKPTKEVLSPEPLKGRRKAVPVEPSKEILATEPLKRGRKPALVEPPKEVSALEPLKRGRKPALVEPPKEVSAFEPLKRGRKPALVEPPKEVSALEPLKRGRKPALVEPPKEVSALEPLKRGRKPALVAPSKVVSSPEPLKRGRKPVLVEPPKEVSLTEPLKRGRKPVLVEPPKEVSPPEPLKRGRKPVLVAPPKVVSPPEPLKRGRKPVLVEPPKEVSPPELRKRGRKAAQVEPTKEVSAPEPLKRGKQVKPKTDTKQENKKKPNLKTVMKPTKSNLSVKVKKLTKAQSSSVIEVIKTTMQSQKIRGGSPVKPLRKLRK